MSTEQENVSETAQDTTEASPITLVRNLRNGTAAAANLSAESRQACVEYLGAEGYSAAEIAEILKISSRTVRRDRETIRKSHAVSRDPKLVEQQVGNLMIHVEQSIQRLRRISTEKDCPHAVRVEAERSSWTVLKEFIETMQSLGYLPTAAREIRADLTHHVDQPPSFEQMSMEVSQIGLLIEQSGNKSAPLVKQLTELKTVVDKFKLQERIDEVAQIVTQEGPGNVN